MWRPTCRPIDPGINMMRVYWKTAAVVLALTVLGGCGLSAVARRDKYLARGKAYLEKQDYSRAIIEFKNAATAMPKDADIYYQLGMAYTDARDFRPALAAFRRAVALNPNHVQARLRIAQMMASTSDQKLVQDAENQLRTLAESSSASSEILNTLGFTELKLGDTEGAVRSFERSLAQAPGELSAYVMLARAKLLEKDTKSAEEALKKACDQLPKSPDAHRLLGEFYVDQTRLSEAGDQFRRALELDARNGPALMNLARIQLASGDKQTAEQSFKRLTTFDGYKSTYATFLFQEGQRDLALREFERLARENPNDRAARTNLIIAYRAQGRLSDVDRVLAEALKKNPKDTQALLQRGETSIEAAKYAQAEIDLNEVLRQTPSSPEVHFLLAKLHQAKGDTLTYRQELSQALQLNRNLQPIRVELAQNLINSKQPKAALDVLDEAPEAQKASTPILVQRNWALWALGDMAEMRKGIDRGLAQQRSADLLIQDGLWKLRANDPSGARAALEQALKIDPSDLRALQVLNQTYQAQKNGPTPLQRVKEYAASQPKSAPVQDFLGVMLMAQGEKAQARSAFAAAKQADPNYVKADLSTVQLDIVDGKLPDARKRLETILSSDKANPTAQLWLGIINEKMGDRGAAIELYRKVAEAQPGSAQALNNLAYLLSEVANKPDEALKYAQEAVHLVPEHPAYCDTLGWILYRKGVYNAAIPYLQRASSSNAGKDNVLWKYHLAMAYSKAGDALRGKATLAAAMKLNPNLPEAKTAEQMIGASR